MTMKRNKPKIYARCPAGCTWETVHKEDFLHISHSIATSDWDNSVYPYTHSLTIEGLLDEDVVIVDASFEAYSEYGLEVEQAENVLTFSVASMPADEVVIKLAVIPAAAVTEI